MIQMDTVDFGAIYACTAVDTQTREAQVVLLPSLTGEDGRRALDLVMAYFGSCELLQTDGGKEFMGEFKQRVRCYAHRHRVARPYRQNEQAFVESLHGRRAKSAWGDGSTRSPKGSNFKRKSKNTWTTMITSGLT